MTVEAIIQRWVDCGQLVQNAKTAILNENLQQEFIEKKDILPYPIIFKNLESGSATLKQCYKIFNQFALELHVDDPIRQYTKNRSARSYDL